LRKGVEKYRFLAEKYKSEYYNLIMENQDLEEKVEMLKKLMLDFDHQTLDQSTQENVTT
jgi:hypothetical protein